MYASSYQFFFHPRSLRKVAQPYRWGTGPWWALQYFQSHRRHRLNIPKWESLFTILMQVFDIFFGTWKTILGARLS